MGERGTERAAADGRAGVGTVAGQIWLQAKVGFGMSGQGELCELGGSLWVRWSRKCRFSHRRMSNPARRVYCACAARSAACCKYQIRKNCVCVATDQTGGLVIVELQGRF